MVERYFGQYDEVYLTPLLRKLSEEFGELDYDPKTIISRLEKAGAVWLEKRRGFPYDYTVLILDSLHPDVQSIRQSVHPESEWEDDHSDDPPPESSDSDEDFNNISPVPAGTSHSDVDNV